MVLILPPSKKHSKVAVFILMMTGVKVNAKWSCYRPGVAQRVGRGIALLFHDRSARRGWMVSSMLRPHFTPGKDPVPILQEAGWVPGPVWTGGKSRPDRDSIPNRPARRHSLYWLSNDRAQGGWPPPRIPHTNARPPPYLLTHSLCLIYNL